MKPIFSYTNTEGVRPFQSEDPRDKYLVTNTYALIQIERKDQFGNNQYLNFYLRPMNEGQYAIIVYIPELVVMEYLIEHKDDLMVFMGNNSISELINASSSRGKQANGPFIAKIKDFTETSKDASLWAIELIINCKLSNKVFIENSKEYNILDDGMVVIKNAADTFYEALSEFYKNLGNISWVKKYNRSLLCKCIPLFEREECFPYFINKISNIGSHELKEALLRNSIVFSSDSGNFYPIGYEMLPEDYDKDGFYLVKLDIFSDDPCLTEYFMWIQLNKVNGIASFRPSIHIGEINSSISDIFNHTDYIKYSKFDCSLLKLMPRTAKIWFYTNPYHEGLSVERFIQSGDTTKYDFPAYKTFIKRDGENLTFNYLLGFTVEPLNLWGKIDILLDLTQSGLCVMTEIINYIPFYKKQVYARAAGRFFDGATFWLNPAKKIIKWLSNK